MSDPSISNLGMNSLRGIMPSTTPAAPAQTARADGKNFKEYLLESLDKVSQLQTEADVGVQKLMTGETNNVAEVFSLSRKAGVAFDLLMEIRNKLMDAYEELKQMRV